MAAVFFSVLSLKFTYSVKAVPSFWCISHKINISSLPISYSRKVDTQWRERSFSLYLLILIVFAIVVDELIYEVNFMIRN